MKRVQIEKLIMFAATLFIVVSVLLVFGGNIFSGKQGMRRSDSTIMPEATGMTTEIKRTSIVQEDFRCTCNTISGIGIVFTRERTVSGAKLTIELSEGDTVLCSMTVNASSVQDQHRTFLNPSEVLTGMKGKTLTLKIYSANQTDTGLKVMMSENSSSTFLFGNKVIQGTLCFSIQE